MDGECIQPPGLSFNQGPAVQQPPAPDAAVEAAAQAAAESAPGLMRRVGQVASATFLALELNPITNEGARFAALAGAQALSENPHIAAGTFAAATLAIEGAGAAATAYLLHSELGTRAVARMNRAIERAKLDGFLRTNIVSESAIALLAGSPAATVVKHRQNPDRTLQDNMRYGLATAAGVSLVSYPLGYAIAEGVAHPSVETIGLGALLLGGVYGAARYLRSRFSSQRQERLTNARAASPRRKL